MNNISLLGNIGKDIDLRFAAGTGKAVAKFSLAVKRPFTKDKTDWLNCISFDKTAELIAEHFQKGSKIAVWGYVATGSFDAKDGTKRYTTDVIVQGFDFIVTKAEGGQQVNNNFAPVDDFGMTEEDSSEIPF